MNDPRINKLAGLLVRCCIGARAGQTVGVSGNMAAEPLLAALYAELLDAGAFPVLQMMPDGLSEIFFTRGKRRHFTTLTRYQKAYAASVDATIRVQSENNTRLLSGVDPAKQILFARTMAPAAEALSRKPWVITLFPTAAYAQDAGLSLRDFEDFVYGAMFVDGRDPVAAWKAVGRTQARLVSRLRGADRVRITGPGTDLTLSVRGRHFVNSDGKRNMPSGEIFVAPVEASAGGRIRFEGPLSCHGREVAGIELVFRKGRVEEASAEKGNEFLQAMLKTDAGSCRLGELGIGTNRRIDRFVKNILFDEKIGGTIHLALGRSPLQTGGRNRSAIHWDLIKDLRSGGSIHVDGRLFQRDGKFV